jgi:iron complex outermembrane receptor protein
MIITNQVSQIKPANRHKFSLNTKSNAHAASGKEDVPSGHTSLRLLPITALSLFLGATLHAQELPAEPQAKKEPVSLSKTVVEAVSRPETAPSAEIATALLADVAGAVSVITSDKVEKGRVGTAADVLAFEPGVFAQSTGGQDALRVSIRGSGINRGQGSFREGITFLFDGLPLTGAGGSPYELFEPLGVSYTEILRGANASLYGGVALGGAINYVTKTGYDSAPGELRLELGSFGYKKLQLASGGVYGNDDYYATVVLSKREGFQDLTWGYTARVIANFGYRINDNVTTRIYVRFGATSFDNPGNLKLAQLEANPTQANPTNIGLANGTIPGGKSVRLQQGSTWIADKTTVKISTDSNLELGIVVHDYPIDIQSGTVRSLWNHDDLALSARYINSAPLFGHDNTFTTGFQTSTELIGHVTSYTNNLLTTETQRRDYKGSGNYVLYAADENRVVDNLWFSLDTKLAYTYRYSNYTYLNGATPPPAYSVGHTQVAPRLGLRYELSPTISFFGNISRAVEPADSWKFNAVRNSVGVPEVVTNWTNLESQTADTIEVGTRVNKGPFEGSLTLYHSWITNELLTIVDPANPTLQINSNATPTFHEGVEASLNTTLWQEGGIANKSAKGKEHRLAFRQAYTVNNFHYRGDSEFGKNQLPGLPRQFYQGELLYEHPSGLYAGVSTQIASSYFVDYDNSFRAPSYTIYNAKIGYAPPKAKWEVYLDFRNLANKHYVTAVSPAFTTRALVAGVPVGLGRDAAVFQPGDGSSVFGGFSIKL